MRSPAVRLVNLNGPTQTGIRGEPRPERVELLRRHDHPGAIRQLRRQRRVARVQRQPHRVVVDHPDVGDRRDLAGAGGAAGACGAGRARSSPPAAFSGVPSLKRTPRRILIVIDFLSRESVGSAAASCGTISQLRVQVVELLAHVQEDHPPDEGPRERRVECVRILGETDRERPACLAPGRRPSRRAPIASKPSATIAAAARTRRGLRVRILFINPLLTLVPAPRSSMVLPRIGVGDSTTDVSILGTIGSNH